MRRAKLNSNARTVLEAVQVAEHHPTVHEIYREVQRRKPGVGLATVYRAARRLVEMGLVNEIDGGSSGIRFDARTDRHDHALCTSCGTLLDLPVAINISAEAARRAAASAGIQMISHEVRLYGRCAACVALDVEAAEMQVCAG